MTPPSTNIKHVPARKHENIPSAMNIGATWRLVAPARSAIVLLQKDMAVQAWHGDGECPACRQPP
jgi:hypothetical protein